MEQNDKNNDVEMPLLNETQSTINNNNNNNNDKNNNKAIDALFWKRTKVLIKLGFKSWTSYASIRIYVFSVILIVSSYVNFIMAISIMSEFYSPLLKCDLETYWSNLSIFMLKYIVLVIFKVLVGYYGAKLRLEWRTEIVSNLQYTICSQRNLANYLINIQHSVDNVDQRVAEDVEVSTVFLWQFLFGNTTSKGLIESISDVVIAIIALFNLGFVYFILVLSYNVLFLIINFIIMRPIVKLQFAQQVLEGIFRYVHLRIREFSESITFYRGVGIEKKTSDDAFKKLYVNQKKFINRQAIVQLVRQYFTLFNPIFCFGMIVFVPSPNSSGTLSGGGFSQTSIIFSTLQSSITPIINIVALSSQIAQIAGTVHRVGDLIEKINNAIGLLKINEERQRPITAVHREITDEEVNNNEIQVINVSCKLPSENGNENRILFDDLTFNVKAGEPTIIVGPSGSGKTSLLRILGGLWPTKGSGTIKKPNKIGYNGIFFLPQRPYLSLSTLREQFIYPHTIKDIANGVDALDKKLYNYLQLLHLDHLLDDYSFDSIENWSDIFSGGEQQRVGFVRVFYHRPKFCIMDEATSALDVDLETICMNACHQFNVTCISVGHRSTLTKFHVQELRLHGDGNYSVKNLTSSPDKVYLSSSNTTTTENIFEDDDDDSNNNSNVDHKKWRTKISSNAINSLASTINNNATCATRMSEVKVIWSRLLHLLYIGFSGFRSMQTFKIILAIIFQIGFVYSNTHFVLQYFNPTILSEISASNGNSASNILLYMIVVIIMGIFFILSQWLPKRVGLEWRRRLVNYLHAKYLKLTNVYAMNHLQTDVDNIDQRIATDVKQFAASMKSSDFMDNIFGYGGLLGTLINLIVAIAVGNLSFTILSMTLLYASITMIAMGYLMIKVAKAKYTLSKNEGDFRRSIARSYEFAESIAFFGGEMAEYESGQFEYGKLVKVYERFIEVDYQLQALRALTGTLSIVISSAFYVIFVVGPNCNPSTLTLFGLMGGNAIVQQLITSVVSIPTSISKFSSTIGNLNRISILDEALQSLKGNNNNNGGNNDMDGNENDRGFMNTRNGGGETIANENAIIVSNVSCKIPFGTKQLFSDLDFQVNESDSLIVMGPSGSGKTSLVRLLGGLWPFQSGTISKPQKIGKDGLFFLPQRPYLALGTLRAQLIYPDQEQEKGRYNDTELRELLTLVKMGHLLVDGGGLDNIAPWSDILSGGEQQRIGFVRLFYHRPKFCIMDEATAALDEESERICMTQCKSRGISFISVGHRLSLIKYHTKKITLKLNQGPDGGGTYEIEDI